VKSSTASAELAFRLIVPQQQAVVPLVASLYYSGTDPYAIRIAFHVGLDEPVERTFARDLLANGLKGREGLGDVQVYPGPSQAGNAAEQVLHIELSSPYGEAHFEATPNDISDFIRKTWKIVPAGQEPDFVDLEAELTDILRQS
jgi:hypothetical protein